MCFFIPLIIIGAVFFFAMRNKRFGPPPWAGPSRVSPEFEAKKTLAERFANGDISSDEFHERASALNWTPGSDPGPDGPAHRRR